MEFYCFKFDQANLVSCICVCFKPLNLTICIYIFSLSLLWNSHVRQKCAIWHEREVHSALTEVKKNSDVCSSAVIFRRRASKSSWKYLKSRQVWYAKMLLGYSLVKAWFLPAAVAQNKLGKVNYSIIGFNLAGNKGMVAASSVSQTARLASLGKLTQAQGKWKNTLWDLANVEPPHLLMMNPHLPRQKLKCSPKKKVNDLSHLRVWWFNTILSGF